MSPIRTTTLIICALITVNPLFAMRNTLPEPSLDAQLCNAITNKSLRQIPQLLFLGANIKIKSKKNNCHLLCI